MDAWQQLFELSDRYGFVIASDECYAEIYFDEAIPPLGALEAAQRLGRDRLSPAADFQQSVQKIECAGHALGIRERAMRHYCKISALSHLSWKRHEPGSAIGE